MGRHKSRASTKREQRASDQAESHPKLIALDRLRDARAAMRVGEYEKADELIMDVMDQLVGWSSKAVAL